MKAVQLVNRGGRHEAIAAVSVPRTEPGSALARRDLVRLAEVLGRQGFVGSTVMVALEPAKMLANMLELPAEAPGVPMAAIAQAEFCRLNKLEPDDMVMSSWNLPAPVRASRATYAMAVGCRASDADAYLDLIESVGLEVEALDACGSAAARACRGLISPAPKITALLDLGWTAATLSILKSDVVIYERRICEAGLNLLIQSMVTDFGVTAADVEYVLQRTGIDKSLDRQADRLELEAECRVHAQTHFARATEELRQGFGYAAHQYQTCDAPRLLLAGGGARMPGLAEFFEKSVKLPVKVVEASDVVTCPPSLGGKMTAAMLAATGLSLFDPE
jgi:hypothetical protein